MTEPLSPSADQAPNRPVPDRPVPEQSVPDRPVPEQSVPEQSVPEQSVPEQSVPDAPAGRGAAAGSPVPGRRRVVVTGLGAISSIGADTPAFLAGLRAGTDGSQQITCFDTEGFAHSRGCQIDGFDPDRWIRTLDPARLGRATQFSVAAARMAVADAGLDEASLRARRCLVSVGTTDGEAAEWDDLVALRTKDGLAGMDFSAVGRMPAGRLSALVATEFGLDQVETSTLATACSAGNYAIGNGFDAIGNGEAEIALCGGAEAMGRLAFVGFYRLGAVAPERCQPFDVNRQGILTGEGGGMLVLESLDSALARGARIHAEVLGYGLNCDASHPTAPDATSVAACMQLALDNAGVTPAQVDWISAHGTATKANDLAESGAVHAVFGSATAPRTVSIKSMLGHSMGASSALASIACVLSITEGFIPPTINHVETDPICAVDCVPNQAVAAEPVIVQNNGLAFGGNNAVVLYGRYQEEPVAPGPVAPSPVAQSPGNPVITAWSALSALGQDTVGFTEGIRENRRGQTPLDPSSWATPLERAGLVPGFDIRERLGRKGTRSMDRRTGLAVAAVRELLNDGGTGQRIPGVGRDTALVLGTSMMPVQGGLDFGHDTWTGERPYHVDAGQFAAMVMNAAAAQCAIWEDLHGPNATLATGRTAGLAALQYARRLHRAGRAETVLCGAAIEFSAARAWLAWSDRTDPDTPAPVLGEGAAVWLLESAEHAAAHGRPVLAELAGVEFGAFTTPAEAGRVLAQAITRLLDATGTTADQLWAVADSGQPGALGDAERTALSTALGPAATTARRIASAELLGDTDSASAAFQLTALLAHAGTPAATGRAALLTAVDRDGQTACALLRM